MLGRSLPRLLLGLLLGGTQPLVGEGEAPPLPNILLIYTDDQGYGDASCLNPDAKFKTPNQDRLAREGMTFTDAHCSDTVCTPSRYGLLTGRYSWRTTLKRGVFGAEAPCLIADGRVTLASFLRGQENTWKERIEKFDHHSAGPYRGGKRELYDLAADPGEKRNVLIAHPEVEQKLPAQLTEIVTSGATRSEVHSANDTPPWADLGWIVE